MNKKMILPEHKMHLGWTKLLIKNSQRYSINTKALEYAINRSPLIMDDEYSLGEINGFHKRLVNLSGDEYFSVSAGKQVEPLTFSCYSIMLATAPTVYQYIKDVAEYSTVIAAPINLLLIDNDSTVELWIIDDSRLMNSISHENIAMFISIIFSLLSKSNGGYIPPSNIHVRNTPFNKESCDTFANEFNSKIFIGSESRKITFNKKDLMSPLLQHDKLAYTSNKLAVDALKKEAYQHDILKQIFRFIDNESHIKRVNRDSVAESLSISTRTLDRRLSAIGTSFKIELDRYKYRQAIYLQEVERLPTKEIAYRLGFSDIRNLSRALRHWESKSL